MDLDHGATRLDDGALVQFRVSAGTIEVKDEEAYREPTPQERMEIVNELTRRIDTLGEELLEKDGRLQLLELVDPEPSVPATGARWEDFDEVPFTPDSEDLPEPRQPLVVVKQGVLDRVRGIQVDPEVYVPNMGFTHASKVNAGMGVAVQEFYNLHPDDVEATMLNMGIDPEEVLDARVAKSAIASVRRTAEAESSVRRFAAVWEDLTVRIPFTDKRIPLPAADPLISLIPGVGEVVDGVLPTGVFVYNGLKARLGVGAMAKGLSLQATNFLLHILKYGGPTVVVKFIVDWFFNSVTATTHDFTKRRQQAIEVARLFGITEEDIDKVSREAIQRSTLTEEKTQNSRIFKRRVLEAGWAFLGGHKAEVGALNEAAGNRIERGFEAFLDWFYPLTEDRRAAEEASELRRLTRKAAGVAGKVVGHGAKGAAIEAAKHVAGRKAGREAPQLPDHGEDHDHEHAPAAPKTGEHH